MNADLIIFSLDPDPYSLYYIIVALSGCKRREGAEKDDQT